MSILQTILKEKQRELEQAKSNLPIDKIRNQVARLDPPRSFTRSLQEGTSPRVIAEIKRASPSQGIIKENLEIIPLARAFKENGAACLSVLTDKTFFHGDPSFILEIKNAVDSIPILRKDFIIDPYQVWESRLLGADAILLIVRCLSQGELKNLYEEASSLSLDVLIEVHNEEELERYLRLLSERQNKNDTPPLLGINNRDLDTFVTDLSVSEQLSRIVKKEPNLPPITIVSESGIESAKDISRLMAEGIHAFLIGESLIRAADSGKMLASLLKESRKNHPHAR